ncbi:MAG: hypothetical protein ACREU3_04105 [Steroidobacteraceae bacterium]
MSDSNRPIQARRRTPADATDFEKEQLRPLLSESSDLPTILTKLNPSLAWLRFFVDAIVAKDDKLLAAWIAHNFADTGAIREVVDNLHLLGPDAAKILQYHLDHVPVPLPSAIEKAWRLLIQSMRTNAGADTFGDWFEIAPRVRNGDTSPELLSQFANAVRPKIRLSSPTLSPEQDKQPVEHPWQLLSINFDVSADIIGADMVATWPEGVSPAVDIALIAKLMEGLRGALDEAIYAEVEDFNGYSRSCADVPSVADHPQNAHRRGFLVITRVLAHLWERLAAKSPTDALHVLQGWKSQHYKLIQRLVLFASAHPIVPAEAAGQSLLDVPQGDFFLSGARVEVVRLIKARWSDIPIPMRDAILHRICEGPPHDWFRQGVPVDQLINLARFEVLADMERQGLALNADSEALLRQLRSRWPDWQPEPARQAGFLSWIEGPRLVTRDGTELDGVADEDLVAAAARLIAEKGPLHGELWQGVCRSDPDRAARGLKVAAATGDWPEDFWRPLLWSQTVYSAPETAPAIATLLQACPVEEFRSIVPAAAWWLSQHMQVLTDAVLWSVWDRISEGPFGETDAIDGEALTTAMNSPLGRLADVLLQRLAGTQRGQAAPPELLRRLDQLVSAPGRAGMLARLYLAANVYPLFERVPDWTREHIVPIFDWSNPDASQAWAARKYVNHIGSPELFALTKRPLLELFGRSDTGSDEARTFSQWLISVLIANRRHSAAYPLTEAEVRTALRRADDKALPSVAQRLMVEMKQAPEGQQVAVWRSLVGPIFEGVWPLDVSLQTSASTFALVQLLRATGEAFPLAADIVIPFIRPDGRPGHMSVIPLIDAPEALFVSAPAKMLELTVAVVGDAADGSVYGLTQVLDRIRDIAPELAETPQFRRLVNRAA